MDSSLKETIYNVSGLLLEKADNMTTVATGISMAVSILQRLINDLIPFDDGRDIPENTLDSFIISLEFVYRELLVLEITSQLNDREQEATAIVRNCLATLRSFVEIDRMPVNTQLSHVHAVHTGAVGRPSFQIPRVQLSYLVDNGFSVPQIADMLGVSVRTVCRRMSDFGLSIRAQYSHLDDADLDSVVADIQSQFPTCGNRQMQGHLLSRGYRVQQARVREAQRRVDPNGSIMRRLHVLNRREYSVPSPRSLYHIDGHHKLIR